MALQKISKHVVQDDTLTGEQIGTIENFTSTGIDDNATANALTIDSSSNLQFNSGYGSVATAYGCRAWVNFNGTGTVAIRGSGNVSSITDNGTGDYTTNFTTAMPDDDYTVAFAGTIRNNASGNASPQVRSTTAGWTTGEGAMLTTSV